jgi:Major Facilitator Superfamily
VLPFVGELLPWQATFVALGLPGLGIALLMFLVPEPRRTGAARTAGARKGVPVSCTVDFLKNQRRTFVAVMFGTATLFLAVYAWSGWAPTYFVREHGWTYPKVGKVLGIILALSGPVGALGGAWLADFWRRRGLPTANLRVCSLSCAGMALSTTGMVLGGSLTISVVSASPRPSLLRCSASDR